MTTELDAHICLPEPELLFHPDHENDRDIHPLRGLLRFGPHSGILMPDPIRVATIAPAGESDRLYGFMKELNSEYAPTERREYLPKWPGFRSVFGVHMRGAGQGGSAGHARWPANPSLELACTGGVAFYDALIVFCRPIRIND